MPSKSICAYRKLHGKCTQCCKPNDNIPRILCRSCMKKKIDYQIGKYAERRIKLLALGIKLKTYKRTKKGKYED